MEGTVAQTFDFGPSFCFMSKNENGFVIFANYFSRLHEMKPKA